MLVFKKMQAFLKSSFSDRGGRQKGENWIVSTLPSIFSFAVPNMYRNRKPVQISLVEESHSEFDAFIPPNSILLTAKANNNKNVICYNIKNNTQLNVVSFFTQSPIIYQTLDFITKISRPTCKYCYFNPIVTYNIPCHHISACIACINHFKVCPVCFQKVSHARRLDFNVIGNEKSIINQPCGHKSKFSGSKCSICQALVEWRDNVSF